MQSSRILYQAIFVVLAAPAIVAIALLFQNFTLEIPTLWMMNKADLGSNL